MSEHDLVLLASYSDSSEAEIVKGRLASEGISAFIADDNMVGLNWLYSNALGGVKVKVRQCDLEKAKAILDQPVDFGDEFKDEEEPVPPCPHCKSKNVVFQRLNGPLFLLFMLTQIPLPLFKRKWKCQDCNTTWKESVQSQNP